MYLNGSLFINHVGFGWSILIILEKILTKVLKIKDKIKSASLKESRSILFAFIIQLIIFFILQFFEFGFNISEKLRGRKWEEE